MFSRLFKSSNKENCYGLPCDKYKQLKNWKGTGTNKTFYKNIAENLKGQYEKCKTTLKKTKTNINCDEDAKELVKHTREVYKNINDPFLDGILQNNDVNVAITNPTERRSTSSRTNLVHHAQVYSQPRAQNEDESNYENMEIIGTPRKTSSSRRRSSGSISRGSRSGIFTKKKVSVKKPNYRSKHGQILQTLNTTHSQKIKDFQDCFNNPSHTPQLKERCRNDLKTLFKITKSLIIMFLKNKLMSAKTNSYADPYNIHKNLLNILTKAENKNLIVSLNQILKNANDELKKLRKNTTTNQTFVEDLVNDINNIKFIITDLQNRDYPRIFQLLIEHEEKLQNILDTELQHYNNNKNFAEIYGDLFPNKFTRLDYTIYNNYLKLIHLSKKNISMLIKLLENIDTINTINNNINDADYYNNLLSLEKANLKQFKNDITNPYETKLKYY